MSAVCGLMFLLETISASHSPSGSPRVEAPEGASGERPKEAAFRRIAASATAFVHPGAQTRLIRPVRSRVVASARNEAPVFVNLMTPTSPTRIFARSHLEVLIASGMLDAGSLF